MFTIRWRWVSIEHTAQGHTVDGGPIKVYDAKTRTNERTIDAKERRKRMRERGKKEERVGATE